MIFVLLVTSSLKGWKKWRLVLKLAGVWLSGKVDNHGTDIYDTGKLMVPGREARGTNAPALSYRRTRDKTAHMRSNRGRRTG